MLSAANDIKINIGFDPGSLRQGMDAARKSVQGGSARIANDLNRVERAANDTGNEFNRLGKRAKATNPVWAQMRGRLLGVAAAVGSVAAAAAAIRSVDSMTMMNARMVALTGSAEQATHMNEQLYKSAQRLSAPYEAVADSATRMLPAVQELGGATDHAVALAEILAATARASGASAQEAASSATQFSQALGSGKLAGDELKSILENNQVFARALAQALGENVGALKELGAAGELTSARVANALLGDYDRIMAGTKNLANTMTGAWTRVSNATAFATGQFAKSTSRLNTSATIVKTTMDSLSRVIEAVGRELWNSTDAADSLSKSNLIWWGETAAAIFATLADVAIGLKNVLKGVAESLATVVSAAALAVQGEFDVAWISIQQGADKTRDYVKQAFNQIFGADSLRNKLGAGLGGGASTSPPPMQISASAKMDGNSGDISTVEQESDKRIQVYFREASMYQQAWTNAQQSVTAGFSSLLQGMANGALSFRDAWRQAMQGLGQIMVKAVSDMGAKWVAGELFRTKASGIGAAQRGVIETGAAAKSVAVNSGAASKNIMTSAWEGMAAAYKAIAGIPYVGPVLAPVAAGVAFAGIASLAGNIASAEGGYDIPAGVNPITQLHEKEMVLPKAQAEAVRKMTGEDDGKAFGDLNLTVQAVDGESFVRYVQSNRSAMAKEIRAVMKEVRPA